MHKIFLTSPVSFTGSDIYYTKHKPNFPQQNNIILQKMVSGIEIKWVNFKDFSLPNKEIQYFSRTLTEFKDFSKMSTKL